MSSISSQPLQPHIALFPAAGMGHLTPFLRVAAMLASYNVAVTVITPQPTVSAAESDTIASFFAIYPQIKRLDFHIIPYNSPTPDDPFFIHWEATNRSLHLLHPLISSLSPPLTAIFSDFTFATNMIPNSDRLQIPTFILFTTSAKFLSLMANYPFLTSPEISNTDANHIQIPGLTNIQKSSIPPPLLRPGKSIFISTLASNIFSFSKVKGILLDNFQYFESETITAFNNGQVQSGFPPLLPIGPIAPYGLVQGDHLLPRLNKQPAKSVVYVSFGSRTAMSKDQIRAIGDGLPILAWPLHGDQRINAEVVEKSGLGLWEWEWGWGGEKLISEQEIGEKIKVLMEDEILRAKALKVGKEARKAVAKDGGSEKVLAQLINSLNPKGKE